MNPARLISHLPTATSNAPASASVSTRQIVVFDGGGAAAAPPQLRSLRYQGERGFALMSQRWRVLQHVMVSPSAIGDIAKAALVLVQFEHKMIS